VAPEANKAPLEPKDQIEVAFDLCAWQHLELLKPFLRGLVKKEWLGQVLDESEETGCTQNPDQQSFRFAMWNNQQQERSKTP
jgi:hypothetical protein